MLEKIRYHEVIELDSEEDENNITSKTEEELGAARSLLLLSRTGEPQAPQTKISDTFKVTKTRSTSAK